MRRLGLSKEKLLVIQFKKNISLDYTPFIWSNQKIELIQQQFALKIIDIFDAPKFLKENRIPGFFQVKIRRTTLNKKKKTKKKSKFHAILSKKVKL